MTRHCITSDGHDRQRIDAICPPESGSSLPDAISWHFQFTIARTTDPLGARQAKILQNARHTDRGVVLGRGAGRPEEQTHLSLGQVRFTARRLKEGCRTSPSPVMCPYVTSASNFGSTHVVSPTCARSLIMPNERTLVGMAGRSLQCQEATSLSRGRRPSQGSSRRSSKLSGPRAAVASMSQAA